MTVYAARDSVLVNSRAPEPLHRCELCQRCTWNPPLHLDADHPLEAAIFDIEGADIDILFSLVGS